MTAEEAYDQARALIEELLPVVIRAEEAIPETLYADFDDLGYRIERAQKWLSEHRSSSLS